MPTSKGQSTLEVPAPAVAIRVAVLTSIAMMAFAANSILCRLALKNTSIDPATFTSTRLASGALALWVLLTFRQERQTLHYNWPSALALFGYAAAFSFAYVSLSAGTGALLLFGSVQATMIVTGLLRGERLSFAAGLGLALALGGLMALVAPGVEAPPTMGSLLMIMAGSAWGLYSLRGRHSADPVLATTSNFLLAVPMALVINGIYIPWANFDPQGLLWAMLSGTLASGMGYILWYAVLPKLTSTRAAVVQLSVPVLAALGGIAFLGERLTLRLVVSAAVTLSGIALVIISKSSSAQIKST